MLLLKEILPHTHQLARPILAIHSCPVPSRLSRGTGRDGTGFFKGPRDCTIPGGCSNFRSFSPCILITSVHLTAIWFTYYLFVEEPQSERDRKKERHTHSHSMTFLMAASGTLSFLQPISKTVKHFDNLINALMRAQLPIRLNCFRQHPTAGTEVWQASWRRP